MNIVLFDIKKMLTEEKNKNKWSAR